MVLGQRLAHDRERAEIQACSAQCSDTTSHVRVVEMHENLESCWRFSSTCPFQLFLSHLIPGLSTAADAEQSQNDRTLFSTTRRSNEVRWYAENQTFELRQTCPEMQRALCKEKQTFVIF